MSRRAKSPVIQLRLQFVKRAEILLAEVFGLTRVECLDLCLQIHVSNLLSVVTHNCPLTARQLSNPQWLYLITVAVLTDSS